MKTTVFTFGDSVVFLFSTPPLQEGEKEERMEEILDILSLSPFWGELLPEEREKILREISSEISWEGCAVGGE